MTISVRVMISQLLTMTTTAYPGRDTSTIHIYNPGRLPPNMTNTVTPTHISNHIRFLLCQNSMHSRNDRVPNGSQLMTFALLDIVSLSVNQRVYGVIWGDISEAGRCVSC